MISLICIYWISISLFVLISLRKKLVEYDRRHGYRGPGYRTIQGTDEYLALPEAGYPENWIETLKRLKHLVETL